MVRHKRQLLRRSHWHRAAKNVRRRGTAAESCSHTVENADLVLLDEPTTGLDAESRLFIEKTISGLQCNILMVVMHEYSPEFLSTFNRVINVENGHIYEKSLPEVINHEAVKICESNQGRS